MCDPSGKYPILGAHHTGKEMLRTSSGALQMLRRGPKIMQILRS